MTHRAQPRCEVRRYYAPPPRRVVYWRERPYQWNVNVGVYLSDAWLNVSLGDLPPAGHYYYDRRCDTRFTSLYAYRDHCHARNHSAVIDVIAVGDACGDSYGYEPGWAAAEYDDDWDD